MTSAKIGVFLPRTHCNKLLSDQSNPPLRSAPRQGFWPSRGSHPGGPTNPPWAPPWVRIRPWVHYTPTTKRCQHLLTFLRKAEENKSGLKCAPDKVEDTPYSIGDFFALDDNTNWFDLITRNSHFVIVDSNVS